VPPRPPLRRRIARIVLVWAIEAAGLFVLAAIFAGVSIDGWEGAFSAVAVVGLLNALLWPLLTRLILPLLLWTLGLAALVLNGVFVLIASDILPGFEVEGIGAGIVVAFVLAATSAGLSILLAIDDEDSFYRQVVLRAARRAKDAERTDVPGVIFLEIDGLSIDTLRRTLSDGHLPTLSRWLREGTHRVVPWECDLSSQTGASQAGLLHGNNFDMPAFRWYEKENDRVVVSNSPPDAAELEKRISDGAGLLARGGASRGNLFSGDATRSLFTLSMALEARQRGDAQAFFADPYNLIRTLLLSIADLGYELVAASRQRRRDVRPRVSRGGLYPLLRAVTTVVLRDLNVYTLIGDIFRGVPSAYATFVGYDEVAHHSGVERSDALDVLRRLDGRFARLEAATRLAPRPYRLAVLSDHGQSQGATFKQRFGETLEEVVQRSLSPGRRVAAVEGADESWGHLSGAATEIAQEEHGTLSKTTRALTRSRREDGAVTLGPGTSRLAAAETREDGGRSAEPGGGEPVQEGEPEEAEAVVLASGCLGLIYFRDHPGRLSYEELGRIHPELVASLVAHPGVAFVLVRSDLEGGLVIGAGGRRRLDDDVVEGADPLQGFGPSAAVHLARTDGFPHAPDVLVNSLHDPLSGEVAAFEELVGSHGGIGGPQSRPFALVPSEWSEPGERIVGAEAMHRTMLGWLDETRS
jgi:uncharacterized membrane protein YvlD (DUF360 family)